MVQGHAAAPRPPRVGRRVGGAALLPSLLSSRPELTLQLACGGGVWQGSRGVGAADPGEAAGGSSERERRTQTALGVDCAGRSVCTALVVLALALTLAVHPPPGSLLPPPPLQRHSLRPGALQGAGHRGAADGARHGPGERAGRRMAFPRGPISSASAAREGGGRAGQAGGTPPERGACLRHAWAIRAPRCHSCQESWPAAGSWAGRLWGGVQCSLQATATTRHAAAARRILLPVRPLTRPPGQRTAARCRPPLAGTALSNRGAEHLGVRPTPGGALTAPT